MTFPWPYHPLWHHITAYGDIGLTLLVTATLTLWLLAARNWRAALLWLFLFVGVMGVIVISKVAFIGWGIGIQSLDFTGFSGHAMRAAAVYPLILYLVPWRDSPRWRMAFAIVGFLFAALISWSRVIVHAHSISEAVTGSLLGLAVALVMLRYLRRKPATMVPPWLIALTLVIFTYMPHRYSSPTQSWLIPVAMRIAGHDRPFERECWCFPLQPWQGPHYFPSAPPPPPPPPTLPPAQPS